MKTIKTIIASTFLTLSINANAQGLFGASPYLQRSDSPFFTQIQAGTVQVEDFEDGLFNIPGVTASTGTVIGPGGLTDSVDADDGTVNGNGSNGRSFFSANGSGGINFTFTGTLPTRAGLVWTDGSATVNFQAFDQNGTSLGVFPTHNADNSNSGETAEDRFFGAMNPNGISRIFISNSSGGIEMDHLQFEVVPEPGSAVLMGLGAVVWVVGRKFRRKI